MRTVSPPGAGVTGAERVCALCGRGQAFGECLGGSALHIADDGHDRAGGP
jgi:hypothetical protein